MISHECFATSRSQMQNKIFILLFIAFGIHTIDCRAIEAGLSKVWENDSGTGYIDNSSVKHVGKLVYYQSITSAKYNQIFSDHEGTRRSYRHYNVADCSNMTFKIIRLVSYSGSYGDGDIIKNSAWMKDFRPVSHDGETLKEFYFICNAH